MNEEKEFLNETEEQPVEFTEQLLEETPEDVTEEMTEDVAEEMTEEFDDEQTLYEQDLLDAEPEPTPEQLKEEIEQLKSSNKRFRRSTKILSVCTGVCAFLMLIFLGGMIGVLMANMETAAFSGLQVGKSYEGNIEIADYSALTYEDTYTAPTEADVDEKIKTALANTKYLNTVDVTDALAEGDTTKINFDGYIDGKIYDSACAKDYELELGSNKFIPGFEDGLIGKKVGEKVTLNLTFPKDYTEESLQGKAVRFEVEILSATRKVYDELTDDIVKEITKDEYKTVSEYKDSIYKELDEAAKENAKKDAYNEIWDTLLDGSQLKKYPQNMYDFFLTDADKTYSSYYSMYAAYGVTDLESFARIIMRMDVTSLVETQIAYHYITYTIATDQGITLTEEDYEYMQKQAGVETREQLKEKYGDEFWRFESDRLYTKVTEFLYENATAK